MEIFFSICAFLLLCIISLKLKIKSKHVKHLPGPKPLPIIGNMHQLIGSLPHRKLADLAKKCGPLMHLQLGEISTVIVSSSDVAKEVLSDHDITFASRPFLLGASIIAYDCDLSFAPYGEYWRQLRKICTIELLSAKRVQTFRSIREEEVSNMITSISSQEGSAVNLSKMIYSLTYSITARAAFGKKSKLQDEFVSIMENVMRLMGGFSLADMYPSFKILERVTGMRKRLEMAHNEIDRVLVDIVSEHRRKRESGVGSGESKKDLVDVLLDVQESGDFGAPLTDNNLKAITWDMFAAGGETSSTTTLWAMSEMMRNPTAMKRAQDEVRQAFSELGIVDESRLHELKFLQAVIKEAIRLHPALPLLLPRENSERCEINGHEIPARTRVFVNAWAMARDPVHWTEPEEFKPERFLDSDEFDFRGRNFRYIPFGSGRRICPGISFALPNVELPLAQLLYHFDWKLPGELKQEELDMTEEFGLVITRKNDLKLVPLSYGHSV